MFNGSHRTEGPGYFEWWYLHFLDKNGFVANAVLHETDIFGLGKKPYYSVSLLNEEGVSRHFNFQPKKINVQKGKEYLDFGGVAKEDQTSIEFNLEFPNQAVVSGKITKVIKPIAIEDGILFEDDLGRKNFWVVQIPHGKFQGLASFNDSRQIGIDGVVYQDHQWGELPLQDFVSDWIWGHFGNEDFSIIFYKILTSKQKAPVDRFILVEKGKVDTDISFETQHLNNLIKNRKPQTFEGQGATIVNRKADCSLEFSTGPSGLMRGRVDEDYNSFRATYLRWNSSGKLKLKGSEVKLSGVTEYLRIR